MTTRAQKQAQAKAQGRWYRRLKDEAEAIGCTVTRGGPNCAYILRGEWPSGSYYWADSLTDLETALDQERYAIGR